MSATNSPSGTASALRRGLPPDEIIFGKSAAMEVVRRKVEKVAEANVPLLLQGESGTGKEVLARMIHERSVGSSGPFVKLNCAAIPGTLLESELFGYERGAFTGAYSSKPGRLELTQRGTLFLDEVAELDYTLQAKLLQVLQDGRFNRIGGSEEKHLDARVVCSANRNLERDMAAGTFRADLFYRINVISIQMPRLCERRVDISILADYFLERFNSSYERNAPRIHKDTIQRLESYSWPGNIRELQNWVARYVLLDMDSEPKLGRPEKQFPRYTLKLSEDGKIPLKAITRDASREIERHLILEVLNANHWNRRKTAQVLNISYRALIYKIRQTGLSRREQKQSDTEQNPFPPNPSPAVEF